jgi:transcriptional antiterminator RfaH
MAFRWYVLRTEPRAEYMAAGELGRDGFEIFFPRVLSPQPRLGHADTPLFPGYLFLRCDSEGEGWPSLRLGHRVSGWVSFGGIVPSIPDELVAELMGRVDSINATNGLWRRFRPGERVRVVSKTLESLAQVVEEAKSPHARALVLLQFMGRVVEARVPWADLQPVQDQPLEKLRVPRRTRGGGRWVRGYGPNAVSSGLA